MSTNYYIKIKTNVCHHCCRHDDICIHIGKRSLGWKFLFGNKFKKGREWIQFAKEHENCIYDEYGRLIQFSELFGNVEELKRGRCAQTDPYLSTEIEPFEYLDEDGYRISIYGDFC